MTSAIGHAVGSTKPWYEDLLGSVRSSVCGTSNVSWLSYQDSEGTECVRIVQISSADILKTRKISENVKFDWKRFNALTKGWDGYMADPPSKSAIREAQAYHSELCNMGISPRIAASVVGGIGITCVNEGVEVYVEIYNDGEVYQLVKIGKAESVIEQVSVEESVSNHVKRIWEQLHGQIS